MDEVKRIRSKSRLPRNSWNLEMAADIAKEAYINGFGRSQFNRYFHQAWKLLRKNGLLDKYFPNLCNNNEREHVVYRYYFPLSNAIYIGRTLKIRIYRRDYEHKTQYSDSVYKHSVETKQPFPQLQVIEWNLTLTESQIKEGEFVEEYRKNGYTILNKSKTGLGSSSIGRINSNRLTKKHCHDCAKKCRTLKDFKINFKSEYTKSCQNKWLKDFSFLRRVKKENGFWDVYENFYKELEKYNFDVRALKKSNPTAYQHGARNGFTKKFIKIRTPHNKKSYTIDFLKKEAKQYTSKRQLQLHNRSVYNACRKNGILDEIFGTSNLKPNGYWNDFNNFYQEWEKRGKSLTRLRLESSYCYKVATKNGFLEEVKNERIKPIPYNKKFFSDEELVVEAKKYTNRKEFKAHSPTAWKYCKERGLLDIVSPLHTKHES